MRSGCRHAAQMRSASSIARPGAQNLSLSQDLLMHCTLITTLCAHPRLRVTNRTNNGYQSNHITSTSASFLQFFLQRDATPAQHLARKSVHDVDGCRNVPLAAM